MEATSKAGSKTNFSSKLKVVQKAEILSAIKSVVYMTQ